MVKTSSERDQIIEKNLGLVHSCARRFIGRGVDYDDLFQAGCVGLIKAVDNFDEGRGFLFSTYAVPVILGEIKRIFRDEGTVRVSRSLKDRARKILSIKEQYSAEYGAEPTVSQISVMLGISPEETAQAINAALPVFSLTSADDDEKNSEFDIPSCSYECEISDKIALKQVMNKLDEKDRQLLEYRYFKSMNQTDTARLLGMSQVQVSRREKALLLKLRRQLI